MRGMLAGIFSGILASLLVLSSVVAQSTPEPTTEELQDRISELEAENEELLEENERLRTRIEEMSGTSSRTPRQGSEEQQTTPELEVGETWTSDEWSITVTYVEATPVLSTDFETNTARGAYIIVHMDVVNEGAAPASFPYRDLQIIDNDGRTYSVDDDALFNLTYVVMGAGGAHDEFQPGLQYSTGAIFDIPATLTGLSLTTSGEVFVIRLD